MRFRTVLLLFIAVGLAGGTAMLARAWLAAQRAAEIAEAAPLSLPTPAKSVLVARADIRRGHAGDVGLAHGQPEPVKSPVIAFAPLAMMRSVKPCATS